jgi:hypothetical protein
MEKTSNGPFLLTSLPWVVECWLRRNRTSETGIVDYEVSRLATKRLQAKNESQIASACPIFFHLLEPVINFKRAPQLDFRTPFAKPMYYFHAADAIFWPSYIT